MKEPFERIQDSKQAYRRRLAALPFGEKLRILEEMRERDRAIRAGRKSVSGETGASEPGR